MIDIHITIIDLIMNQGITNAPYYQDTKEEKNRRTTGPLSPEETAHHPAGTGVRAVRTESR